MKQEGNADDKEISVNEPQVGLETISPPSPLSYPSSSELHMLS